MAIRAMQSTYMAATFKALLQVPAKPLCVHNQTEKAAPMLNIGRIPHRAKSGDHRVVILCKKGELK